MCRTTEWLRVVLRVLLIRHMIPNSYFKLPMRFRASFYHLIDRYLTTFLHKYSGTRGHILIDIVHRARNRGSDTKMEWPMKRSVIMIKDLLRYVDYHTSTTGMRLYKQPKSHTGLRQDRAFINRRNIYYCPKENIVMRYNQSNITNTIANQLFRHAIICSKHVSLSYSVREDGLPD